MHFEEIKKDTLYIALEISNSNKEYNLLENGVEYRTLHQLENEFLTSNTESLFVKLDDTYIGMIDFLKINPNDGCPWLGLLMIHSDYKGYGFGTQAYLLFENKMREKNLNKMRLGVLKDNLKAHGFWESLGYRFYQSVKNENGKEIMCYEKELT